MYPPSSHHSESLFLVVLLSNFQYDSSGNVVGLEAFDGEDIETSIRITPPLNGYVIDVAWELVDESGTIVREGNVSFPEQALNTNEDIQTITISGLELPNPCTTDPRLNATGVTCQVISKRYEVKS